MYYMDAVKLRNVVLGGHCRGCCKTQKHCRNDDFEGLKGFLGFKTHYNLPLNYFRVMIAEQSHVVNSAM